MFLLFRTDDSLIGAILSGTLRAVPLVFNIAATVLVFISALSAIDGLMTWLGSLVDIPNLRFVVTIFITM